MEIRKAKNCICPCKPIFCRRPQPCAFQLHQPLAPWVRRGLKVSS